MSDTPLSRFLGGSPMSVITRLIIISLIIGAVMVYLDVTPENLVKKVGDLVANILGNGLESVRVLLRYVGYGAVVVVPIFLVVRFLKMTRSR